MQKLAEEIELLKQKTFKQTGEMFGKFIPDKELRPEKSGPMSRVRLFSKENTFWAFFSEVISPDGGCKEVVRKLQAYASVRGVKLPSSSTASYCAARKKLEEQTLESVFRHTSDELERIPEEGALNGRRVVVVDGTGASMPDTPANQEEWPQSRSQKPGCGFPTMRICGCFSLQTGGLLSYETASKKSHELPLLRKQSDTFREDDIFLGDKGFCSFYDVSWLREKEVDSVVTLARRKPVSASKAIKKLGENDLLIKWKKPAYQKKCAYSREEWEKLPNELVLRQIKVVVAVPGFRVKEFYIVTTLLDNQEYSVDAIAELYLRRWDVELFFRDIKTTMGMDILRCLSPDMVRKEVLMHFIAYNCIRRLMYEAAEEASLKVREISFKGSLQALRSWEPHLNNAAAGKKERLKMISDLYEAISNNTILQRPGRREPRCVKRRPKPYQLMTKPRHEMEEIPHKSQYRAKTA